MTQPAKRNTRQRGAVAALLDRVDGFHSAQDLHAMLREEGDRVGLTTVYRTLQAMADDGEVTATPAPTPTITGPPRPAPPS